MSEGAVVSEKQWRAAYKGAVTVTPTAEAQRVFAGDVVEKAARRRDDILIALEVQRLDAARAIARALADGGEQDNESVTPAVEIAMVDGGGFSVDVTDDARQSNRAAQAATIATALQDWLDARAHKVALWSVTFDVTAEAAVDQDGGANRLDDKEAVSHAPDDRESPPAEREQPVLWGIGAVLFLLGLTVGGFYLVSVLAVGN
jgi:hypothetical protein